jgi:hypothetical protein
MTLEQKQKYIETYFDWLNYECADPYDEIEFLINCALNGNDKDNIIDVLETTFKRYFLNE